MVIPYAYKYQPGQMKTDLQKVNEIGVLKEEIK